MTLRRAMPFWARKKAGVCSNPPITGLLDLYPGAKVAYSFRRLRNSYTGDCMRLGGVSATLEAGFCNNYIDRQKIIDATDIAYNPIIDPPNVYARPVKWYDQSENNNHLTGSLSSNNPLSTDTGAEITLSSNVFISWNNEIMTFDISEPQIVSVFAVYKRKVASIVEYFLYKNIGGTNNGIFLGGSLGGISGFGLATGGAVKVNGVTEDLNTHLGVYIGASERKVYVDSVLEGTWGGAPYSDPVVEFLGNTGSNVFKAYLAELIIYETDKTSDLAGIQSNINSFYSIY